MAAYIYKVIDEFGCEVFRGDAIHLKRHFKLDTSKKYGLTNYTKHNKKLKGKYTVIIIGEIEQMNPYKELILRQCELLKYYDSVVGYNRNIEKNIRDLENLGFRMEKRQVVDVNGKRKSKYWILEKAK